jgi:hypothetical protein
MSKGHEVAAPVRESAPLTPAVAPEPVGDNAFTQDQLFGSLAGGVGVGVGRTTSTVPADGYEPVEASQVRAVGGSYLGDLGVGVQSGLGGRARASERASLEAGVGGVWASRGVALQAGLGAAVDVGAAEARVGFTADGGLSVRVERVGPQAFLVVEGHAAGRSEAGVAADGLAGVGAHAGAGVAVDWRRPISATQADTIDAELDAGGADAVIARFAHELHAAAGPVDGTDLAPGERVTRTESRTYGGEGSLLAFGAEAQHALERSTTVERTAGGLRVQIALTDTTTCGGDLGVGAVATASLGGDRSSTVVRTVAVFLPNGLGAAEARAALDVWSVAQLDAAVGAPSVAPYLTADDRDESETRSVGVEADVAGAHAEARGGSYRDVTTRDVDGHEEITRTAGRSFAAHLDAAGLDIAAGQREEVALTTRDGAVESFQIGGSSDATTLDWAALAGFAVAPFTLYPSLLREGPTALLRTTTATGGVDVTAEEVDALARRATSDPRAWEAALTWDNANERQSAVVEAWNDVPAELAAATTPTERALVLQRFAERFPSTAHDSLDVALTRWAPRDARSTVPALGTRSEWPAELAADHARWVQVEAAMATVDADLAAGRLPQVMTLWSELDQLDQALSDADFADPRARLDMLEQVWRWQIALQKRGVQAPWAQAEPTDEVSLEERVVAEAKSHADAAIRAAVGSGRLADYQEAGREVDAWAAARDDLRRAYTAAAVDEADWRISDLPDIAPGALDADLHAYARAGGRHGASATSLTYYR